MEVAAAAVLYAMLDCPDAPTGATVVAGSGASLMAAMFICWAAARPAKAAAERKPFMVRGCLLTNVAERWNWFVVLKSSLRYKTMSLYLPQGQHEAQEVRSTAPQDGSFRRAVPDVGGGWCSFEVSAE